MGKPDQGSAAAEGARRATGDAAGPGRGGRLSVGRKREAVLRLLRGEDLESVSRAVGITAARASPWRDRCLAAGQASLMYRPRVLGQWFDGIRFYAAASSPTRSRRTCAGLR